MGCIIASWDKQIFSVIESLIHLTYLNKGKSPTVVVSKTCTNKSCLYEQGYIVLPHGTIQTKAVVRHLDRFS